VSVGLARPGANGRLTLAVPAKGRMAEPAVRLCADAGLSFELTERSLVVPCANAPVDLLLVRPSDIPEYAQDGVVDVGITGANLVAEAEADVAILAELGFARCSLEAAVPVDAPQRGVADLNGLRVATSYPVSTRRLLSEAGVECSLVPVSGSVEAAPRLGLADAIVDLVSSGSTMRTNGLRSLGALFRSEAVLVGRRGDGERARRLATILRTVVDAREARYLMLNAPESALDEVCALVPGSRAPSVMPLAEPGMVAVHALVPAADVWSLLPRLERAGASSILLVPVERMLG
jgi:ATP phosphoribosyltransferase